MDKAGPRYVHITYQPDIATIYRYRYKKAYHPVASNETAVFRWDDQLITLIKNGLLKHDYKPYK